MAEPSDKKLSRRQWFEIATLAFIVALILWLLRNSFQPSDAYQGGDNLEIPDSGETSGPTEAGSPTYNIGSMQPIGIPPLQLPGTQNDCCGCNGCSAGTIGASNLSQIIATGNAAIAAMQSESDATLAAIAQYGDIGSGGDITYSVE